MTPKDRNVAGKDTSYFSSGSYLRDLEEQRALMKAGLTPSEKALLDLGLVKPEKIEPEEERISPEQLDRKILAELEAGLPDLWQKCYPRIYSDPKSGLYFSSKKPAHQMLLIATKVLGGAIGESEQYEFQLACHLAKYRVPQYWLGADMAEAIRRTTPPQKIAWYNMPLPFEAAVFIMPRGSLTHKTDGDVPFICYARLRAGEEHRSVLIPNRTYGSVNGSLLIAAAVEKGFFIHWNLPLTSSRMDAYNDTLSLPEIQALMMKYSDETHPTAVPLRDGMDGMTADDHALGLDVAHYIFSTLMVMTARPELVTNAALERRIKTKKDVRPKEFWTPAVIGANYKIRRERGPSQGGTHASPRFHWVPGHLRYTAFGPGRKQRKEIPDWIEPYTRGGEPQETK